MAKSTAKKKEWLKQLVNESLCTEEVITGYLEYYPLPDHVWEEMLVQIVLFAGCSVEQAETVIKNLKNTIKEVDVKEVVLFEENKTE